MKKRQVCKILVILLGLVLTQSAFGQSGAESPAFSSGQAFLKSYEPNRNVCLVLDCDLSDGSSMAFLGRLSARGVDIPAILIGWCGDATNTNRAASAAVVELLEKPFDDQLLLDAIERAFDQRDGR